MSTKQQKYEQLESQETNKPDSPVKRKERVYYSYKWHPLYPKLGGILIALGSTLLVLVQHREQTILENKYDIAGLEKSYFGFYKDVSDSQWNSFQSGLFEIGLAATIFTLISHLIRSKSSLQNRVKNMATYNIVFGLGFATYLFHIGIVYFLLETILTFFMIKFLVRVKTVFPIVLWGSQLLILFANELMNGYGFKWISNDENTIWPSLERDMHDGSEIRWHVMYNLTVLKIISFGMDQYWSYHNIQKFKKKENCCKQCESKSLCYKARQEQNIELSNFSLRNYLGFILYSPTFIAGPITTFNCWVSHAKHKQTTYDTKGLILYCLRTAFVLLSFEIWCHIIHGYAMLTNPANSFLYDDADIMLFGSLSLFTLVFIWYKFLSIWRVFRTWALLDGFETPENMNRCVCNNYCFEGFWRSWHRSFNQWLIRYIFIPCGGSQKKKYNIWVVFTFVAVWHDINLNLLLWAWVICLVLIPEMLVKNMCVNEKNKHLFEKRWFKFASGWAGSFDGSLMVFANLIGFGNGKGGVEKIMEKLLTLDGMWGYFKLLGILASSTCYMIYIRDAEAKRNKKTGF